MERPIRSRVCYEETDREYLKYVGSAIRPDAWRIQGLLKEL